ncbi:AsmA family protein [Leptolyngbya sp. FACHB-261]|uniref:AsmA family protein n=1 Tax=Leptolyngbya sp. FACHB-261 TaxID=2692806 RepID=UPI0016871D0C|nr:AsmA family protein [Leptolyngbya sp. FACHB-261]MBD2102016.1 AsmA family protein [Leptolyngbya sp. FACHB-261]
MPEPLPPSRLHRVLIRLFGVGAGVLLALVLLAAALPVLVDPSPYRLPLEQALSQATGMVASLEQLEVRSPLRHWGQPALVARLRLVEPSSTEVALAAPQLAVRLALRPLLRGQLQPSQITIEGANLLLHRHVDGLWNWQPLLNHLNETPGQPTALECLNTTLTLVDDTTITANRRTPATYRLTQTHLHLAKLGASGSPLKLDAQFLGEQEPVPLHLQGKVAWNGEVDVQLRATGLRPQRFRPYWQPWLGLRELDAASDLNWHLSGRWPEGLSIVGSTQLQDLNWQWSTIWGPDPFHLDELKLDVNGLFGPDQVQLQRLTLTATDWAALATGRIQTLEPNRNPQVALEIVTSWLDPYRARHSLPLAAVPEPYRGLLQTASGQGDMRSELTLQGHLSKPQIEGIVEFNHLAIASPELARPIDAVDGQVLLKDGQLKFRDLRLRLSDSALVLSGQLNSERVQVQVQGQGVQLVQLQALLASKSLQALRNQLPIQPSLEGLADLNLQVQGTLAALEIKGEVALIEAMLHPGALQGEVQGEAQTVEFSPPVAEPSSLFSPRPPLLQ